MDSAPIVYCGCWESLGHMTWAPGMGRLMQQGAGPWEYLDSGKLNPGGKHGDALLTQKDGWTALGITDRSVDSRPGSHSTFAMQGTFDFDQSLDLAKQFYGEVIDRIGEIRFVGAVCE